MITLPTRTLFPAADNQVIPPPIILIQGESQGREISITMMDGDGTPLDLTAAAAVALYYTKPDGTEEQLPCVVEDAENGTVSVTFTSSSCAVAGDMRQVIIRITWSDASNSRYVGPRIHVAPSPSDDAAESSNEFALLDQLIIQAQEVIGDAGEAASAANTAASAANAAAGEANTAAGTANTAATAANAAKDAANTAAGAANTAAGAANTAAGAANTAADRANQAAEDAEAVLEGAVTSVNGKTGAVTLAAADVGALPTAGGTMTGPLVLGGNVTINAGGFSGANQILYPAIDKLFVGNDEHATYIASSGAILANRNSTSYEMWDAGNLPYEAGTWTPKLGVTDGSGTAPTVTYTKRPGRYIRLGRLVFISFQIQASVTAAGTGYATVDGLPYAYPGNASVPNAIPLSENGGGFAATPNIAYVYRGTYIRIQSETGTNAVRFATGTMYLSGSGFYETTE